MGYPCGVAPWTWFPAPAAEDANVGVLRGVRVAGGVALVALGTAMAAPRIQGLVALDAPLLATVSADGHVANPPPGHVIPDAAPPPAPSPAAVPVAAPPAPALPPPVPLPAVSPPSGAPTLGMAYRSTLALPPPPLLDVAPPAGQAPTAAVPAAAALQRPAAVASDFVRDGDDLTTIAVRVYGHPGAAGAILAANRDRITDPALLPVGIPLRLPPAWSPAGDTASALPVIAPPRRPARVIVAAGETFESLAQRFYGNAANARMLFEANRDRVRSPALLTAGTELRLP